jgi:hypothetical protein
MSIRTALPIFATPIALLVAGCSHDAVDLTQDLGTSSTTGATTTTHAGGSSGTSTSTGTTTGTTTSTTTAAGGSGQGGNGTGGNGDGGSGTGGAGGAGGGAGGAPPKDAGADGGPVLVPVVYAHSPNTLYKLDPVTKAVKVVGDFKGCSSVIDIAIDKDGVVWGTTFGGLYTIDPVTAKCQEIALGSYPNSLSFVPKGTLDPNEEALVGYVGADYVRIDTKSGSVTKVGSLGNQGYASSGDVVSVIGGGTYLTVNGNGCADCIVEVNPTTGALVNKIGSVGHSSVYGLAFWAGVAYGFDDAGELFQIDLATGASSVLPIPGAPPGLEFWGAGSTTAAPLHQ